jgi:hypothetical protein
MCLRYGHQQARQSRRAETKKQTTVKTKKTANTAKVGESYERTRFEIQTLNSKGTWSVFSRHDDLVSAIEFYREHLERLESMRWVFDHGQNPKVRFVEAKAVCTIIQ